MFAVKSLLELERCIAQIKDVNDIHFTKWHQHVMEVRIRRQGILSEPCWDHGFAEKLWEDLFWHGALLQRDLNKPQHAMIRLDSLNLALRLSYAPTALGQRLVVRIHAAILSSQTTSPSPRLDHTGLSILYGLTGSGKTTHAYQWLDMASQYLIVISIEDPPECLSRHWTQFDRNITEDDGLHHLVLRQNPDVLFWGELRDKGAWKMIENWVTTGHHVVTTLHARSQEQCYDRLSCLGADPDFLARYMNHMQHCHYRGSLDLPVSGSCEDD